MLRDGNFAHDPTRPQALNHKLLGRMFCLSFPIHSMPLAVVRVPDSVLQLPCNITVISGLSPSAAPPCSTVSAQNPSTSGYPKLLTSTASKSPHSYHRHPSSPPIDACSALQAPQRLLAANLTNPSPVSAWHTRRGIKIVGACLRRGSPRTHRPPLRRRRAFAGL